MNVPLNWTVQESFLNYMPDTFGKISERADGRAFFFIACLSFLRAWSVRVVEFLNGGWLLIEYTLQESKEEACHILLSMRYQVWFIVGEDYTNMCEYRMVRFI